MEFTVLRARIGARIARLRRSAGEIDYARKRLLEIRTGHTFTEQTRRRRAQQEIDALYALFRTEPVSWGSDAERERLDAPDEDRRDDWPGVDGP
jgi:hypothetical protein